MPRIHSRTAPVVDLGQNTKEQFGLLGLNVGAGKLETAVLEGLAHAAPAATIRVFDCVPNHVLTGMTPECQAVVVRNWAFKSPLSH